MCYNSTNNVSNGKDSLMKPEKAILWDLDGTLLDTLEDLADGVNHALTQFDLPTYPLAQIRSFVGNGARRLIVSCLPQGEEDPLFNQVFEEFQRYYKANCRNKTKPYPGILPLLRRLQEQGVAMSVVSNKPHAAVVELAREHFEGLLTQAVGEQAGIPRKPNPDMIRLAIEQLGSLPQNTVYVGDSEVDVATAINADMDCAAVSYGFRSEEELIAAGAKVICHTVKELREYLIKA